jgi:predicted amidohydrolase YtcJ
LGLDFRGEQSAQRILNAFAERSRSGGGVLLGGNFEDPLDRPLTRHDLDDVAGGRPALLARADMHSCIVSSPLLDQLDLSGLNGVDRDAQGIPTGYLREQGAGAAWTWFDANLGEDEQRHALTEAVRRAYAKGIASVHEMFVVEWRGWSSLELLLEVVSAAALEVVPYVATTDIARVQEIGLRQIGGDLFLDGSFGSHTAWLSQPYESKPPPSSSPTGLSYRTDDELLDFFTAAQTAGLQTGVHAIGDAAIEQAIATWEAAAERLGKQAVRRAGHRIEHFECASDDHIARAAALGLRISVQPAFDRLWGGPDALYAHRIGRERAVAMNRFKSMAEAGLVIGAGSDSTVTPMDPFLQMASLRTHHVADERFDVPSALEAHTVGGRALADRERDAGTIAPGQRADLALVDRDPLEVDPDELIKTEVLGTWIRGQRVWPESEAETQ